MDSNSADCPICDRPLGTLNVNEHHWRPKCFKNKEKSPMHMICHNKIHSIWTERELEKEFFEPERIRENDEMQRYIKWVSKFPPAFYESSKDSRQRSRKRRRR